MRPALHVVCFKYSNRFHPSVGQIHCRTERDFQTLQINTCHIYSTIPSSNRGKRQEKMILKCINIRSLWNLPQMQTYDYARAALWDAAIKFSLQSRATTLADHLARANGESGKRGCSSSNKVLPDSSQVIRLSFKAIVISLVEVICNA